MTALKIKAISILVQYKGPVQVARRSDMDMNGHINNVTYLAWALETVPTDIYLNYVLIQASAIQSFNAALFKFGQML